MPGRFRFLRRRCARANRAARPGPFAFPSPPARAGAALVNIGADFAAGCVSASGDVSCCRTGAGAVCAPASLAAIVGRGRGNGVRAGRDGTAPVVSGALARLGFFGFCEPGFGAAPLPAPAVEWRARCGAAEASVPSNREAELRCKRVAAPPYRAAAPASERNHADAPDGRQNADRRPGPRAPSGHCGRRPRPVTGRPCYRRPAAHTAAGPGARAASAAAVPTSARS